MSNSTLHGVSIRLSRPLPSHGDLEIYCAVLCAVPAKDWLLPLPTDGDSRQIHYIHPHWGGLFGDAGCLLVIHTPVNTLLHK